MANPIVPFPSGPVNPDEELIHRQEAEAERLSRLAPGEWRLWLPKSAERVQLTPEALSEIVLAKIKARDREADKEAAKVRDEDRKAHQKVTRQVEDARREERKTRRRYELFADIKPLSPEERELRLTVFSKERSEDLEGLRAAFEKYLDEIGDLERKAEGASSSSMPLWVTEPWSEPVDGLELLDALERRFKRHVVFNPSRPGLADAQSCVSVLWSVQTWFHEEVAKKSPILAPLSRKPDSGKSTLLEMSAAVSWRPTLILEPTRAGLYRDVDQDKPSMFIDEARNTLLRNPDAMAIVNGSWSKGYKIPRDGRRWDPFCPKALGLRENMLKKLPDDTLTRCFIIRMVPKKESEIVEDFYFPDAPDDAEILELRRKIARWHLDNVAALKKQFAKTTSIPGLSNRRFQNGKLLFAIADLVGGDWPERMRKAALLLVVQDRQQDTPDWDDLILNALFDFVATARNKVDDVVTTEEIANLLTADPDSPWREYRKGKPISKNQVSLLIKSISDGSVLSHVVHPDKSSDSSPSGYEVKQFLDLFERYLKKTIQLSHSHTKPRAKGAGTKETKAPKEAVKPPKRRAVPPRLRGKV